MQIYSQTAPTQERVGLDKIEIFRPFALARTRVLNAVVLTRNRLLVFTCNKPHIYSLNACKYNKMPRLKAVKFLRWYYSISCKFHSSLNNAQYFCFFQTFAAKIRNLVLMAVVTYFGCASSNIISGMCIMFGCFKKIFRRKLKGNRVTKSHEYMRVLLARKVCKMGSHWGRFYVNTLPNVS